MYYCPALSNNRVAFNSAISPRNVFALSPEWYIPTPTPVKTCPIPYRDRLLFTDTAGNAYNVCQNGNPVWSKNISSPANTYACPYNSASINNPYISASAQTSFESTGVVYKNIWYQAGESLNTVCPCSGKLYALDPLTGTVIWFNAVSNTPVCASQCDLIAYNGLVYCGLSSAETGINSYNCAFCNEGRVAAIDAGTGARVWCSQDPASLPCMPQRPSSVVNSLAIDPATDTLYCATGNTTANSCPNGSCALLALDANTGGIKWTQQVADGDIRVPSPGCPVSELTSGPQLFTICLYNQLPHPVLGVGGRDGFYYCFDRASGALVWSTKVSVSGNPGLGINTTAAVCGNRVFACSNNGYTGNPAQSPCDYPLTVACLDAATGEILWSNSSQCAASISSGIYTYGCYLVGDLSGKLTAFNSDGSVLYSNNVSQNPITSDIACAGNRCFFGTGDLNSNSTNDVICLSVNNARAKRTGRIL
ncbi:MAG TPA: PQQ-binding-like beta-propeller repeat protein [Clostridia bacterium]|nr:PQQ-binding-like beta-propeller repeat protein [Clostridia bacterium]